MEPKTYENLKAYRQYRYYTQEWVKGNLHNKQLEHVGKGYST